MRLIFWALLAAICLVSCNKNEKQNTKAVTQEVPFVWEGANIYFLLTDRFNNGNPNNDVNFNRTKETGKLRGFKGGDIKGVTQKIKEGYFKKLGVNAIWMTPIVEQIHGGVDEGTGFTYGFHGYWASDWTNIDPNFGTKEDLHELVTIAHKNGIRILLDAVINHTGPVTEEDNLWPNNWVRTEPQCDYKSFESTTACTLVENLPDIKTENNDDVELPKHLIEKWKKEGRYAQEMAELDAFFKRTGHPKAPRFYIMKWLADYISEFGIDGYRADTVKHTEPYVWQEFKAVCDYAFEDFKVNNPDKVLDDNDFYLVGEIYNYGISAKKVFDFGDKKVNYFDDAFSSLINFEAKWNAAEMTMDDMFQKYSDILNADLKGYGLLNYLSSHDDGDPFDPKREKPYETAIKLLLCPGTSQVYYGDESGRSLVVEGTVGDATLRSFMNWEGVENNVETQSILSHWQKLGVFRANHPAVGAGVHHKISESPYIFSRSFSRKDFNDMVIVGLDLPEGEKSLNVSKVKGVTDGDRLYDAYSQTQVTVLDGKISLSSPYNIVLLEKL